MAQVGIYIEQYTDMRNRGLPVRVTTPKESLAEQLSCTVWEMVGRSRPQGTVEEREKDIVERLRAFRRQPSSSRRALSYG